MCSPVRASQIAHALKLSRVSVVRFLEELIKHGYVGRVGNPCRVPDKVNIPELTAKRSSDVRRAMRPAAADRALELSFWLCGRRDRMYDSLPLRSSAYQVVGRPKRIC